MRTRTEAAGLLGTLVGSHDEERNALMDRRGERDKTEGVVDKGVVADRMAWWREARFGMFIHWGLYALPAGVWNGRDTGIGLRSRRPGRAVGEVTGPWREKRRASCAF
jgi:hypothetical protein